MYLSSCEHDELPLQPGKLSILPSCSHLLLCVASKSRVAAPPHSCPSTRHLPPPRATACPWCSFNAQQWVYPKGVQERQYQLSCIQTALLHNTLVCLPTGLGKTLIAAVVMHNFTRWFPQVGGLRGS